MQNQYLHDPSRPFDGPGLIGLPAAPRRPTIDDMAQLAKLEILVATRRAYDLLEYRYQSALGELFVPERPKCTAKWAEVQNFGGYPVGKAERSKCL